MTEQEKKLLELFRKLDKRGKENVLWLAEKEAEHTNAPTSPDFAP